MSTNTELHLANIAVERIGSYRNRPTIVFLHDSLGCIKLWRDFPQRLSAATQCNVLIYDRQGYGQSCPFSYDERAINYLEQEADILNDLLVYWGLDQVLLFGHSDGGSIALLAAAKYPHKIMGIITEGAHIYVEDITLEGIQTALHLYKTTNLKEKLEKYHGDKTAALFEAWAKTWTKDAFRSWNIESFLPAIQCPSLIIQGEDDEYGTLQQVYDTVAQCTGPSTPFIIPQVMHTPHKEVPELILERVVDFVESLE